MFIRVDDSLIIQNFVNSWVMKNGQKRKKL